MKKIIVWFVLSLTLLVTYSAVAADSFVVKKIRIEGLQRVSTDTVYSYLPIKEGQTLRSQKTASIIQALYKTGFFERIALSRSGNTLIIKVTERPTIGQLKISGNSVIATDKLTTVMKSVDIAEGRVYNQAVLDKIKLSLLNQYYQLGRYNARVEVTSTPEARNRMLVNIVISEGLVAKVARINLIGNHAFSDKKLEKQLELTTSGWFTFFTKSDVYSQEKVDASLEDLRNYYLDRGYLKVAVKSSQVAMTPDRKTVYITVVIDEGALYKIKGYSLSGDLILPREDLQKLVKIKSGDVFSRQLVINSEKSISDALGNKGYVFSAVTLRPEIDESTKQVFLNFNIIPGKRAYVRHIFFVDNSKTNDVVLRREIEQMEAGVISTGKLDQSKHRLSLLPYVKDVQMSILPVANKNDQVDVNYKVTEDSGGQVTFSVGYSQLDGIILGAGVNQKNFMGTGNTVGVNFTRSHYQQYYGMNYVNPYYTLDGISRSINLSISRMNPGNANLTSSYTNNEYDASVVYGIPIGQEKDVFNRVQLGYGYQNTLITLNTGHVSTQVNDFVAQHGRGYQQLDLIGGISRDSRDKAIFPTRGMIHTVGLDVFLPVAKQSLTYYMTGYDTKWYFPLNDSFIVTTRGDLGYGNGFKGVKDFPFFKNYYAGGISSVRGYTGNTLGPKDSNNQPSGGNLLANASVGMIFPNYISDNLRTTAFVDGGNVYNTYNNRSQGGTGSGPPRLAAGVEGDWLTPLGLVDVSLAKPLNERSGDNAEIFQFSLGANFG